MKKNLFVLLAMFGSLSASAAQETVRVILNSGNWGAAEVRDHALWRKDACLAGTRDSAGNTLEVYAEKTEREGVFGEPTIQIVTKTNASFVRAVIQDEKKRAIFHLTLASTAEATPVFGLLSRMDDRKKLIELLKKANVAYVTLVSEKNRVVESLSFSLKGSTKAINAAFEGCGLVLE